MAPRSQLAPLLQTLASAALRTRTLHIPDQPCLHAGFGNAYQLAGRLASVFQQARTQLPRSCCFGQRSLKSVVQLAGTYLARFLDSGKPRSMQARPPTAAQPPPNKSRRAGCCFWALHCTLSAGRHRPPPSSWAGKPGRGYQLHQGWARVQESVEAPILASALESCLASTLPAAEFLLVKQLELQAFPGGAGLQQVGCPGSWPHGSGSFRQRQSPAQPATGSAGCRPAQILAALLCMRPSRAGPAPAAQAAQPATPALAQALWTGAEALTRAAALKAMAARDLPQDADFAECVVQVLQALQASLGVAILGASGCGKTTCLAVCKVGRPPAPPGAAGWAGLQLPSCGQHGSMASCTRTGPASLAWTASGVSNACWAAAVAAHERLHTTQPAGWRPKRRHRLQRRPGLAGASPSSWCTAGPSP